ncbi:MAG: DUF6151 family protein [Myxococcota bacterium]
MTTDVALRCRCGQVRGSAHGLSPWGGVHVVCYCHDCRAFARWLGGDDILDAHGGTDIFQLPPAHVRISAGERQLCCLRLTPQGVYRWYAGCCRTPIGNMVGPRLPVIGLIATFMRSAAPDADGRALTEMLGRALAAHASSAVGGTPPGVHAMPQFVLTARLLPHVLAWRIGRKHQPSAFFDAAGRPVVAPEVLSPSERARLSTP